MSVDNMVRDDVIARNEDTMGTTETETMFVHQSSHHNGGNQNIGNDRNQNQNPINVGNDNDWDIDDDSDNDNGWNQNHDNVASTIKMEGTTTKLGDYDDYSPILFAEGNDHHVEVRPELISVLPFFKGNKRDDQCNHLYDFLSISNTNTPRATKRLIPTSVISFTLKEKSNSLAPSSITIWDQLKTMFLQEFYPASKTIEIRKEFNISHKKPNEEFHDAFKCLK
uniref:Retrotransposon gag domain-containing protein n=1 Tax=Lactuca sativa TaxID=4236 RepID=A0A9R1UG13_LACSA|nr:hypothetical protein LSAT_V11C900502780 [Lactuca sativa]